jgi:uracil-DNA glycosylase
MISLLQQLPADWRQVLAALLPPATLPSLDKFLSQERLSSTIFPPAEQVFSAFELTPFERVKVLLLGQDPYHQPGQACGLAFSVPDGIAQPPSLRNILKEYSSDLSLAPPQSASLEPWARAGVLLLNTVLTVRSGQANSHQKRGWEEFTDAVINALSKREQPSVFILWGKAAAGKKALIDGRRHAIVEGPHPSPLSAYRGFFGSKPFSKANQELLKRKIEPVNWQLA